MSGLYLLLYLLAAICFFVAVFPTNVRFNLVAAGLFRVVLPPLISALRAQS